MDKSSNKTYTFIAAIIILIAVAWLWNSITPDEYQYGSLIPIGNEQPADTCQQNN